MKVMYHFSGMYYLDISVIIYQDFNFFIEKIFLPKRKN